MKASIQIKLAIIVLAVLSASFAAPAYAIAVFGAEVTASLWMADINDSNEIQLIANQTATVFGSASTGQAFAEATATSLAFGNSSATSTETAAFAGFTPTGRTFAIARALSTGLVFINNTTTTDVTTSIILDLDFSGFAIFDSLAGEFAFSRIAIRVLGPNEFGGAVAVDLIDPILASTSILDSFGGSGAVFFDVFVPSLASQPILLQIEALGRAQVTEPGIFVLFGMGLLALISLHTVLPVKGRDRLGFEFKRTRQSGFLCEGSKVTRPDISTPYAAPIGAESTAGNQLGLLAKQGPAARLAGQ